MITIFWKYDGYVGDEFFTDPTNLILEKFAPNSRSDAVRTFSWLQQKGFGPGYYKNSGVYSTFRKSVFKSEEDRNVALKLMRGVGLDVYVTIYDTEEEYKNALAETKNCESYNNKINPY